MAATSFMQRHATLQESVKTDDLAFGDVNSWTSLIAVRCRVGAISSQLDSEYRRQGWKYVIRLQCEAVLPRTVKTRRKLHELFQGGADERMRFLLDGRTLSPISVEYPNEGGDGPVDFVNVDCIETTEGVGYEDKP